MMDSDIDKVELDIFGQFLMKHLRDRAILHYLDLYQNKKNRVQKLQRALAAFSDEQQAIIQECLSMAIDGAIHDFLFQLVEHAKDEHEGESEESRSSSSVQILVNGEDIVRLSDGIHGELFGEDGWIEKYSEFPDYLFQ